MNTTFTFDQQQAINTLNQVIASTITQDFVNEAIRVMSVKQALRESQEKTRSKAAAVVAKHTAGSVLARLQANAGVPQLTSTPNKHNSKARTIATCATLMPGDIVKVTGTRQGEKTIAVTKVSISNKTVSGKQVLISGGVAYQPVSGSRQTNHSFDKVTHVYDKATGQYNAI